MFNECFVCISAVLRVCMYVCVCVSQSGDGNERHTLRSRWSVTAGQTLASRCADHTLPGSD